MRTDYLESIFTVYFGRKFYKEHEAEINSTSPYAVTDKTPTMRIVDNPITEGSWRVSPVHSSVSRGFFGGVRDVTISGGGGGGSMTTKVQFDRISMCPVTKREFTDADLERYHKDWMYQVESFAKDNVKALKCSTDPISMSIIIQHYGDTWKLSHEQLVNLQMDHMGNDDLFRFLDKLREEKPNA